MFTLTYYQSPPLPPSKLLQEWFGLAERRLHANPKVVGSNDTLTNLQPIWTEVILFWPDDFSTLKAVFNLSFIHLLINYHPPRQSPPCNFQNFPQCRLTYEWSQCLLPFWQAWMKINFGLPRRLGNWSEWMILSIVGLIRIGSLSIP